MSAHGVAYPPLSSRLALQGRQYSVKTSTCRHCDGGAGRGRHAKASPGHHLFMAPYRKERPPNALARVNVNGEPSLNAAAPAAPSAPSAPPQKGSGRVGAG